MYGYKQHPMALQSNAKRQSIWLYLVFNLLLYWSTKCVYVTSDIFLIKSSSWAENPHNLEIEIKEGHFHVSEQLTEKLHMETNAV